MSLIGLYWKAWILCVHKVNHFGNLSLTHDAHARVMSWWTGCDKWYLSHLVDRVLLEWEWATCTGCDKDLVSLSGEIVQPWYIVPHQIEDESSIIYIGVLGSYVYTWVKHFGKLSQTMYPWCSCSGPILAVPCVWYDNGIIIATTHGWLLESRAKISKGQMSSNRHMLEWKIDDVRLKNRGRGHAG